MTPLTKTLLWSIAGGYLTVRSCQNFRSPSSDMVTPYATILLAGLAFFIAFDSYRKRGNSPPTRELATTPEPLTRTERIVFRTLGVPVICVGVTLLGLGCWLAWGLWIRVAHWPRANAVLIRKDISSVGARLIFHYEAEGRRFTGRAFRWGSEKTVRAALESYKPGTIQKISYNPKDPSQVETILSYSLELFTGPIFGIVFGLLLIVGGVVVYRWSYSSVVASPPDF